MKSKAIPEVEFKKDEKHTDKINRCIDIDFGETYNFRDFKKVGGLERLFHLDGAEMMYLTADPVTGKPFWESVGFENVNEKSPENQQYIYEKSVASV